MMEKNGALWTEREFIIDSRGGVVLFLILFCPLKFVASHAAVFSFVMRSSPQRLSCFPPYVPGGEERVTSLRNSAGSYLGGPKCSVISHFALRCRFTPGHCFRRCYQRFLPKMSGSGLGITFFPIILRSFFLWWSLTSLCHARLCCSAREKRTLR